MMTYQDAACEIINLYTDYVEVSSHNDEDYNDYAEAVAVAVEALILCAQQEKLKEMTQTFQTSLGSIAPIPATETFELLRSEIDGAV